MSVPQHGNIPEGSIIITPAEVYAKVTSLTDVVTKLVAQDEAEQGRAAEVKQHGELLAAEVKQKADAAEVKELAGRVSAIEKKIWLVTGAAAAAGGLLGNWLPSVLGQ